MLKPEHSTASPEKRSAGMKEVVFDVGDSRRSSNSVYVPENESDVEEPSELEMDFLDDTSRIPRYPSIFVIAVASNGT